LRLSATIGLTPLAALLVWPLASDGAAGLFQTDLAGLVMLVGVGAFLLRAHRPDALALVTSAALLGGVHLLAGGRLAAMPALWLLALGLGVAASGLAAWGRALRAPALTAGAVAAAVLWIAMTGLVWADDLAASLPQTERYAFRQAVVHLDAATACAYGAADFDRFHDADIYRRIPLVTSAVRPPAAGPTALAWLVVGLLAWVGAALLGGARHERDA